MRLKPVLTVLLSLSAVAQDVPIEFDIRVFPNIFRVGEAAPLVVTLFANRTSAAQLLPGDEFRLIYDLGNSLYDGLPIVLSGGSEWNSSDFSIAATASRGVYVLRYNGRPARWTREDALTVTHFVSPSQDSQMGRIRMIVPEGGRYATPASALLPILPASAGISGPAGPPGPQGPVGPQGPQGLTGPQGAPGPRGSTGPIGPAGPQGSDGDTGPRGPAGATGPAGPAGPAGAPGAPGAPGPAGPQGLTGPAGATGPAGPPGPAGPAGSGGLSGHELNSATYTTDAANSVASYACTGTKRLLGGGYTMTALASIIAASAGTNFRVMLNGPSNDRTWQFSATSTPPGLPIQVSWLCAN